VQLKNGNVVVAINSEADTDLDIWAAENTADVFREAYQIPLVVAKWKS
jgi:hypothetical protein